MLPLLVRTRFQVLFHSPRRGSLSLFPRGTGSLSVSQEYSALEDGPPPDRIPRVPPYSSSSQHMRFCVRGCHPVSRAFPDVSTNTHADFSFRLLPFARRYWGNLGGFLFFWNLDVSVPPVRFINLCIQLRKIVTSHTGFLHSGIAGYNGSYHLTGAYRRSARPSSPLIARASTVYA